MQGRCREERKELSLCLTLSVQTVCRVTQDKSLQNISAAIVFHLPDLHWEVRLLYHQPVIGHCLHFNLA